MILAQINPVKLLDFKYNVLPRGEVNGVKWHCYNKNKDENDHYDGTHTYSIRFYLNGKEEDIFLHAKDIEELTRHVNYWLTLYSTPSRYK